MHKYLYTKPFCFCFIFLSRELYFFSKFFKDFPQINSILLDLNLNEDYWLLQWLLFAFFKLIFNSSNFKHKKKWSFLEKLFCFDDEIIFKRRKYFSSQCQFIESLHLKLCTTCKFKRKIMKYNRCYKVGNLTLTKGLWNKTLQSSLKFFSHFLSCKTTPAHSHKLTRLHCVRIFESNTKFQFI